MCIPDEAAAQDPRQPCSAPLWCQCSASGKQQHPRWPRLLRDLRRKSAMCHPPRSPPPPSQGRTPRVPGLRSRAPGRQRVVSPIPISHRRGDPARSEPAGARCPLVAIAASAASLCKARTHSLLALLPGSTGPATASLSTAAISRSATLTRSTELRCVSYSSSLNSSFAFFRYNRLCPYIVIFCHTSMYA